MTGSVNEFCKNLKSSITNLKNGNIPHFNMKYKKDTHISNILIERQYIHNNGFYIGLLGEQPNFLNRLRFLGKTLVDIASDCRLSYNIITNKYVFTVPFYIDIKKVDDRIPIVAIDPGEKIFAAFYSPENCGLLGEDMRIPLLKNRNKISRQQHYLAKDFNNKTEFTKNIIERKNIKTMN